jgi:hypothetical protein
LVNRAGQRVGNASFFGRSRKAAEAAGKRYLHRLGITSHRSGPRRRKAKGRKRRR